MSKTEYPTKEGGTSTLNPITPPRCSECERLRSHIKQLADLLESYIESANNRYYKLEDIRAIVLDAKDEPIDQAILKILNR